MAIRLHINATCLCAKNGTNPDGVGEHRKIISFNIPLDTHNPREAARKLFEERGWEITEAGVGYCPDCKAQRDVEGRLVVTIIESKKPERVVTVASVRVSKRSLTFAWRCTGCGCVMRTGTRTQNPVHRKCRCKPVRVWVFGPARGDGDYLSETVFYGEWKGSDKPTAAESTALRVATRKGGN